MPALKTSLARAALERVAIIGSGNWGSAIAKIVGNNVKQHGASLGLDQDVTIWVFEEVLSDGRRLTDVINQTHENVKYLPNIKLPDNVRAVPSVADAVRDRSLLIFVLPHQFVKSIAKQVASAGIAANARAISLIKGIESEDGDMTLVSDVIRGLTGLDVSVLMGANIANEVALENFCEATVGYRLVENGLLWQKIFHTNYFRVNAVQDVAGVELCGALKNVVAVGAGFVDGMRLGDNTKAALIRLGLMEMRKYCKTFYAGVKDETFLESCGVADLITTCAGGRNRKVAEAKVVTGKSFDDLERNMLNGQKLQGPQTARDVHRVLVNHGLTSEFPLFTAIHRVCWENLPPHRMLDQL